MPLAQPSFSVGIEEEYLLADRSTLDLAAAPEPLMRECEAALADQVSPEFLRCQIEVGTRVCDTLAEAHADLARLRSTIAAVAERHGLLPLACSTHPFADWEAQQPTPKARYQSLLKDLAGVGRRMLICGLHVHVGVEDLSTAIGFYSALFATQPTVMKPDYAKWMLDDPRVNFAISTRGKQPGLDHLGIQVESQDELQEVYARLHKAGGNVIEQGQTSCCYAKSEKSWVDDPAGISWETFFTTGENTHYGDGTGERQARIAHAKVCCEPKDASQTEPQTAAACCTT